MLTAIKGIYDHGTIVLSEQPPVQDRTDVIVTFLVEEESETPIHHNRRLGGFEGRISLPPDFNEPLDELKDYMES